MIRRLALVALIVAILLGLWRLDARHTASEGASSPGTGAVLASADARGSTWYCAAGADGGNAHTVVVSNLTDRRLAAVVTGYGIAPAKPTTKRVEIAARGASELPVADLGADLGGVSVELDGAGIVEHRLASDAAFDQVPCSSSASSVWHFAGATTDKGSSAVLWVLNPFRTAASFDVRVTQSDGATRVPSALRGVVVPGQSAFKVDLGEQASQRRDLFSFSVRVRSGKVIAELAQSTPAEPPLGRGMRLQVGVERSAPRWLFADSFGGPAVSDRVVVYNPGAAAAAVEVAVLGDGLDDASQPDPFPLDVAPRRFAVVDLPAESRVPAEGRRWIDVRAVSGTVVATQVVGILGAGGDGTPADRPSVAAGSTSSAGSSAAALRWFVSDVIPSPASASVVSILNPDDEDIALVDLFTIVDGKRSASKSQLEVQPGTSLAVDVGSISSVDFALELRSSSPVVIDRRLTSERRADLTISPAVPLGSTVSEFADPTTR